VRALQHVRQREKGGAAIQIGEAINRIRSQPFGADGAENAADLDEDVTVAGLMVSAWIDDAIVLIHKFSVLFESDLSHDTAKVWIAFELLDGTHQS
jgi:hypothetical protein